MYQMTGEILNPVWAAYGHSGPVSPGGHLEKGDWVKAGALIMGLKWQVKEFLFNLFDSIGAAHLS